MISSGQGTEGSHRQVGLQEIVIFASQSAMILTRLMMRAIDISSAAEMQNTVIAVRPSTVDAGDNLDPVSREACTSVMEYGCCPGVQILLLM